MFKDKIRDYKPVVFYSVIKDLAGGYGLYEWRRNQIYQDSKVFLSPKESKNYINDTKATLSYTNLNSIKMILFYLVERVLVFLMKYIIL